MKKKTGKIKKFFKKVAWLLLTIVGAIFATLIWVWVQKENEITIHDIEKIKNAPNLSPLDKKKYIEEVKEFNKVSSQRSWKETLEKIRSVAK